MLGAVVDYRRVVPNYAATKAVSASMLQIHGLTPGFICLLFSIFSQAVSLLGFLLVAFFHLS
jgi:hypothetical protein